MSVEQSSGRRRNARWIILCIAAPVVLSAAGWLRLRIDSSLEPLLPENSRARQTILFLRDSSFASKAVLWYRLTGNGTPADLYAAADQTVKHLDPTLISRVIAPPRESDAMEEIVGMLDHAGELLNEDDLTALEQATTPDALRKRMRECYMQLLKPEGSFMQPVIRRDPLGVSTRILERLYALKNGLGYRVELQGGHLMHPDGRQMLLILETSASATNLASSEALAAHLNALAAAAPPGVQIIPICGQIHTAENDRLMQADTQRAGIVESIAFLLLFLLVSRDWRVGAVFFLPLVAVGVTIGLFGLVHPSISAIMIGVAVTMAGGAVDYGIYVYMAVRVGKTSPEDMRRLRLPLLISHLTTLGVFIAFLFSTIPAYRQLGWLTCISLVLSLLAALFLLPRMLRSGGTIKGLGRGMELPRWGKKMVWPSAVIALLLIAATVISRKTRFDADLSRLDGVTPSVVQNEKDFQHTWGKSDTDMAILAVTGATRDEAEEANDKIYRAIAGHTPDGPVVSMAGFWPSAATQRANQARWRAFWSPQRIAAVKRDLATAAQPYGFSADAFDPFFESLAHPPAANPSRQLLASIEDQFIARSHDDWQMLSYFEDTDANLAAVRGILGDQANALIVSRRALGQAFAESAASETRILTSISAVLIVASLGLLTRSFSKSLLIMLPVAAGIVAMLAVLEMMSMPMNVVSVIAAIVVLGLTSDYGVFAAYAWEYRETVLGQGMASVHLSALTTLVGTGSLLFAKHPALFMVGVSLTSGLLAGYVMAFVVIPAFCWLLDSRKTGSRA